MRTLMSRITADGHLLLARCRSRPPSAARSPATGRCTDLASGDPDVLHLLDAIEVAETGRPDPGRAVIESPSTFHVKARVSPAAVTD